MWKYDDEYNGIEFTCNTEELINVLSDILVITITQFDNLAVASRYNKRIILEADQKHIEEFNRLWNKPYICLYEAYVECDITNLYRLAKKIWNPTPESIGLDQFQDKIGYSDLLPDGEYNPNNKYAICYNQKVVDLSTYPKIRCHFKSVLEYYTGYIPKLVIKSFDFRKIGCQCDEFIIEEPVVVHQFAFFECFHKFLSDANIKSITVRILMEFPRNLISEMEFEKTNLELYTIIINHKSTLVPGLDAAMKSRLTKSSKMI